MFKMANWEIKVADELKNKITLYKNQNLVIAVANGQVMATIMEYTHNNETSIRIDASELAFAIRESERIVYLTNKMSMDEIVRQSSKIANRAT